MSPFHMLEAGPAGLPLATRATSSSKSARPIGPVAQRDTRGVLHRAIIWTPGLCEPGLVDTVALGLMPDSKFG